MAANPGRHAGALHAERLLLSIHKQNTACSKEAFSF